jgi:hypothetical protein
VLPRALARAAAAGADKILVCATARASVAVTKVAALALRRTRFAMVVHDPPVPGIGRGGGRDGQDVAALRALMQVAQPRNLRYLFLGATIEARVLEAVPALRGATAWLDHPYLFEPANGAAAPRPDVVRFGALGVGGGDKEVALLARVAEDVRAARTRRAAEFVWIGPLHGAAGARAFALPAGGRALPRREFDRHVGAIDYGLLVHASGACGYKASGSFLDALSHAKPVIALRTPHLEAQFARLGEIGWLCDTAAEVRARILDIVEGDALEAYARQRATILAAREAFAPATVAGRLRSAFA